MCLGIPMRIKQIDGYNALCEAKGVERNASLLVMSPDQVRVGDIVMIHLGQVMSKMTEQEAQQAWELYDEILEQQENDSS